jgi:hypothetical protein
VKKTNEYEQKNYQSRDDKNISVFSIVPDKIKTMLMNATGETFGMVPGM